MGHTWMEVSATSTSWHVAVYTVYLANFWLFLFWKTELQHRKHHVYSSPCHSRTATPQYYSAADSNFVRGQANAMSL